MILEDVIMLARTVPEPSKKYGVRVCSVAYSPELKSLIRIYPLLPGESMKQRHKFRIELERNPFDSRIESFKKISHTATGEQATKDDIKDILDQLLVQDVTLLNDARLSLGALKASSKTYFVNMKSKAFVDPSQLCLFGKPDLASHVFKTGQDYAHIPYITIPMLSKQKTFQLREWGIYRLLEKHNGNISDTYLRGIFKDDDAYLIVGNLNGCRTVWIVCSYYTFKTNAQQRLF